MQWLWRERLLRVGNIFASAKSDTAPGCIKAEPARILLIAPHGSYRTAPFIDAAVQRNIDILVASEGQYSLVSAYAKGLHIDLQDPGASLEIICREALSKPFAGIIATDDNTIELASQVAQRLKLPHNLPKSAGIARRKDLARNCLKQAGILVPDFRTISLDRSLEPQLGEITYPCVAKPLAMSASRGVIRADNQRQLFQAIKRIEQIVAEESDPTERKQVLVETFIPGFEVAVEGMLSGGQLEVLAIFDKPDPLDGPYFEETYYITPSRLEHSVQDSIRKQVAIACRAYGLQEGPIHAECRINSQGVWILEIAARTIGGLCSRLFQFGVGYSLEELTLDHLMGASKKPCASDCGAGVLMIPTSQAGVLRRVEGVHAAASIPYIEEVVLQVREGHELVPLPEGSSYLGFIFSRAPDAVLAEAALRQAHAQLKVVVAPIWKGITAP